jgi:hypothetical protein
MIYELPQPTDPLSQGDLLDECPILVWHQDRPAAPAEPGTVKVRVVVLTQACDLAQAKATRVLVAVVHDVHHLVARGILQSKVIRDQVRTHRVYGWYFLPTGDRLQESIIDLRDLHTIPRSLLEGLIASGKRIARIQTPYREHLAQHFSTTYARIGLPEAYSSEPDA